MPELLKDLLFGLSIIAIAVGVIGGVTVFYHYFDKWIVSKVD